MTTAKRVVAGLICLALILGAVAVFTVHAEESFVPEQQETLLTLYGRTVFTTTGTLRLFWGNSGFAVRFNGTSLTANLTATRWGNTDAAYLHVYVDGAFAPTKTVHLNQQTGVYTLAEDLSAGEHTVEVRKRNEAAYGGSSNVVVNEISTDGVFLTPPAKSTRQIEFIGDSITSGFGNLVTDGFGDYTSATVDSTMTYAVLAAKQLGAEAQVISRSGIGYCRGTDGMASFFDYYEKTGRLPESMISNAAWDFENHPSDVVVINLGTNDNRATIDGAVLTDVYMTSEAVAFLELVREKNPQAHIVWTYGLMATPREAALRAAVEQRNAAGDDRVYFLAQQPFVSVTEDKGTHGHPSVQAHINRSAELAAFLAEKTGWEWDASAMMQAQRQWSGQYTTPEFLQTLTPVSAATLTTIMAEGADLLASGADNRALVEGANAIWQAYVQRVKAADLSAEYLVVDPCDTTNGASFNGSGARGVDVVDFREGTGCVYASGTGNFVSINHQNTYAVPMPENAHEWYFECWLYVDDPTHIPLSATLEISKTVDAIELSWGLNSLGLQPGWNKVQLPLTGLPETFDVLHSVRLFLVDVTQPVTIKLDHMVLSRGKMAADTAAWNAVLADTYAFLQAHEDVSLQMVYALAKTAVSQADTDAYTARLVVELAAANERLSVPAGLLGDVDGNQKVDSTDARLVLQYAVKKIAGQSLDLVVADVDGNRKVDSTDARLVLQYAVKKVAAFPVA